MKRFLLVLLTLASVAGCDKKNDETPPVCDIHEVYEENQAKPTIGTGAWGTISEMRGNCMPVAGQIDWGCSHCPVKRTIRFYEYTRFDQAVPAGDSRTFFESFSTALVAETESDENGFYEVDILPGTYSVVVIENGKLYSSGSDGLNGISPVTITTGKNKVNFLITYRAAF